MIVVLLASCSSMFSEKKEGSKNITKESKTTESFEAIDVTNALNVFVTMGDKESIVIEAADNIQEHIKTKVRNSTLNIYLENGIELKNSTVNVYVTAVNLESIDASAASNVIVENTIETTTFKCNVSSAAGVNLKLDVTNFKAEASSSGNIEVGGTANDVYMDASSGGDIEAENLEAKVCNVNASSGGGVSVFAIKELKADASSGGGITYKGEPTKLKTNNSSGGSISKK